MPFSSQSSASRSESTIPAPDPMNTNLSISLLFALVIFTGDAARSQGTLPADVLPDSIGQWRAEGPAVTYDRHTIFDYLDGGAEVYRAYGMVAATARRYLCEGEQPIEASLFTMERPDGAFGVFTYERLDADAGVGQGSEYGGGILRFWQGRSFVFIQGGSETPTSHNGVFALGRYLATRIGKDAMLPEILPVLPREGLRPLTVRYAISPSILKNIEPTLIDGPLGSPEGSPAVFARYGTPGDALRILIAQFTDPASSAEGIAGYMRARSPRGSKPLEPYHGKDGWSLAGTSGIYAVLVLDAPDTLRARTYFDTIVLTLKEFNR
jgi:hypothetical protein